MSTVLILALVALLVVTQMQMVFLAYKALSRLVEKHQDFYQLEAEAYKLANKDWQLGANCVVREKDPNELSRLLKNGWGCSLSYEKQQFYYLIEDLGIFPCLQTVMNKITYSTRHLRLSILARKEPLSFLQLRIARKAKLVACEKKPLLVINRGILSWRLLDKDSFA